MARLTEEMVIARSKQSDLSAIKKLNCWGAELGDVSLVRRMPNVEVLALSINKIRTLGDFAGCRRLRELYIRKNEIRDLREIRHLRHLPDLTSLWLDENPCTHHPEYRMTVLRNLPGLEKLDNVPVQPEEVNEAMRRGAHIPDSDDEGYPHTQESYGLYRSGGARSAECSPDRDPEPYRTNEQGGAAPSDSSEEACVAPYATPALPGHPAREADAHPCPLSAAGRRAGGAGRAGDDTPPPAMTRSCYDAGRAGEAREPALRHSASAHSGQEYWYGSNGECPAACCDRAPDRCESYQQVPRCSGGEPWERERDRASERERAPERDREYPSAVMAERRGFTRRPVARNSNLLSAVLCLVKELDYPSLEVAEMAVRCRMDELANAP